ncbi:MAG: DegT/DnrJ/EryC1/StrS family aminotransferase [Armatimonadota bacterium]|nr:DegT/DnrJ/EryC1/StrS family aminotransferase [Armatimonadota bacterium]
MMPARPASSAPALWIRLDPHPAAAGGSATADVHAAECAPAWDPTTGRAALHRVFGCRWLWWAPDPLRAWACVLQALGVGDGRRVVAPVGIEPAIAATVRGRGAVLVEVDLDRHTGFPRWEAAPDPGAVARDAVYLVEHRHGRPCPFPARARAALVIEHAIDGLGGAIGGRPIGALGAAMICALGRAPFARAHGALIGTDDPSHVERLAARAMPLEAGAGPSGALWRDAAGVEDWLAGCRAAAQVYSSVWRGADVPVRPLEPAPGTETSWSVYAVSVPDPDALGRVLEDHGVETRRPVPAGLTGRRTAEPNAYPGAAAFYRHVMQVPNHPELELDDILYVAGILGARLRAPEVCAQRRDALQEPGTSH